VTSVTSDAPGTEQAAATLIYIYGPPASGKLTVAEQLSGLTGLPVFHNHLTVNAVRPVFAFGTPPFTEAVQAMRRSVFTAAARAGISLIYTNNSAWSGPDPRARFEEAAEAARGIMAGHGGRTVYVRLTAPQSALEERVANDSRRVHEKLVDLVRLRELLADLDASPLHPDDLAIDTAQTSPEESARIIAAALG
jgi:chloramphenicol 3-O-phosphotransferase